MEHTSELPPQVSAQGYLIGNDSQVDPTTAAGKMTSSSKSYAERAKERPDLTIDTSPVSDRRISPPGGFETQDVSTSGTGRSRRRKGSVPDRSPLQKLEVTLGDISKEEKRARVEEAEHLARERAAAGIHDVPDGSIANVRGGEANAREVGASNTDATPFPMRVPGTDISRTQSQRRSYGYDAALTGTAAAAAIGAYQASKQQAAKQSSPTMRSNDFDTSVPLGSQYQRQAGAGSRDAGSPFNTSSDRDGRSYVLPPVNNIRDPALSESMKFGSGNRDIVPSQGIQSDRQNMVGNVQRGIPYANDDANENQSRQRGSRGLRFSNILHRDGKAERRYHAPPPLEEWKSGGIAVLTQADLDFGSAAQQDQTWWERLESQKKFTPQTDPTLRTDFYDTSIDDLHGSSTSFQPALMLRCGPLLRYTGLRKETSATQGSRKEFWRGSIMIVTEDSFSAYTPAPTLRVFGQPMELLPENPTRISGNYDQQMAPEVIDPIAGMPKVARNGSTVFAKPLHLLPHHIDLSRNETDGGLFESNISEKMSQAYQSRISTRDGEKIGKYREIQGIRLHAENGVTFWRFNLEVELGPEQTRIAYRVNKGPSIGFWIPAKGQSMNVMFHSCNGFSLSVDADLFSGPDPLWRDVLNKHQRKPFHCMIGGGDQIYNDAAMRDTEIFKEWLAIKNPEQKHSAPFTEEMQNELETFYMNRYAMWFSQGFFGAANSQIPMINMWDDHDIIDGFGSYPHHFMSAPVFSGLGSVAYKYYLLFQHQSVTNETSETESSWIVGSGPGPYIEQPSRSLFISLGNNLSFLGLDCRTERRRNEILSQETYDLLFDRCRREISQGNSKHLIVLLGVPIAYPRLNFMENILTSRIMDPIKALTRVGVFSGFVNKFDGGVEILDDLDDHWTAKHHKDERNWFIQELQELAAETSVRVTILGGDVHLGAVGQFFSEKSLGIPKDHDHRYMPNVISSAIVNTPPPEMMADVLNKRNKIHHLDDYTDEDMIPLFNVDVNGRGRNNVHLLPRRNWCSICVYKPGLTPPPSPLPEEPPRRRRSFSLSRSSSLSRSGSGSGSEKGGLLRRFSSRKAAPPSSYHSPGDSNRLSSSYPSSEQNQQMNDPGFQAEPGARRPYSGEGQAQGENDVFRRSNSFHRRPSNFGHKPNTDRSGRDGHIDLEDGLDVALHCELEQGNPSGSTRPYRLLIPALSYHGEADPNPFEKEKSSTLWGGLARLKSGRQPNSVDTEHPEPRFPMQNPDYEGDVRGAESDARDVGLQIQNDTAEVRHSKEFNNTTSNGADLDFDTSNGVSTGDTTAKQDPTLQQENQMPPNELSERNLQKLSGSENTPWSQENQKAYENSQPFLQRRNSASGPRPPSNIDQLPASVQKRYSQFVHHPSDTQQGIYRSADTQQGIYRSATQPSRKSPFISNVTPPLLPTSERQLRSSQRRSLRPDDNYDDGPRSVSGPAMMTSDEPSKFSRPTNTLSGGSYESQGYDANVPQRAATYHAPSSSRAKTSSAAPFSSPLTSAPNVEYDPRGQHDPYAAYDDVNPPQRKRASKLERYYGASEGQFEPKTSRPTSYQNNANTGPLLPAPRPMSFENHRQQNHYPAEDIYPQQAKQYDDQQRGTYGDEFGGEMEPKGKPLSGVRRKLTKSRRY